MLKAIAQVEKFVAVLGLFVIVASVVAQVMSRYIRGKPITWVLELTTYMMIWSVFLGASYAHKQHRHITIVNYRHMSLKMSSVLDVVVNVLIAVAMILVIHYAGRVMPIEARTNTSSLPIDVPRHLFYSLPVFVSACSIFITSVYFAISGALAAKAVGAEPAPIDPEMEVTGGVY